MGGLQGVPAPGESPHGEDGLCPPTRSPPSPEGPLQGLEGREYIWDPQGPASLMVGDWPRADADAGRGGPGAAWGVAGSASVPVTVGVSEAWLFPGDQSPGQPVEGLGPVRGSWEGAGPGPGAVVGGLPAGDGAGLSPRWGEDILQSWVALARTSCPVL